MTQPQNGGQTAQIAPVVSLDTTHANGFVTAGVEKCWTRFDHREMHDVFIVISEGRDGEHIARTVYAAERRRRAPNTPGKLRRRAHRRGSTRNHRC